MDEKPQTRISPLFVFAIALALSLAMAGCGQGATEPVDSWFTPPAESDTTPPSVQITIPSGNTTVTTGSISLAGTASDNTGVTQVTWKNNTSGATGTASGLTSWSVANVTLQSGSNSLTVTAKDAAGNQASASRTVTYSPPATSNVTLAWESPTTNSDNSCLTDLSGFIVSYGTSPGSYSVQEMLPINSLACTNTNVTTACGVVQTCSYTVRGLSSGRWYFSTSTYNSKSVVSPLSNETSQTLN